jgi:hypothetical protein
VVAFVVTPAVFEAPSLLDSGKLKPLDAIFSSENRLAMFKLM